MRRSKSVANLSKPVFKALVFTDNHVGYKEDHPSRGPDTFNTLEEILRIGVEKEVDIALQSGDLYHELFPTHSCMCRTLRIFEKYVFGDKKHGFQYIPPEGLENIKMNFELGKCFINFR